MTRSVHEAATEWASYIKTAPRHFSDLITAIEVRDDGIERVAREVVRRDLREERAPSTEKAPTPPRLNPHHVDPFSMSLDELRVRSSHVAACRNCVGRGGCACTTCNGSKQMRCGDCGGSGQVLKHYQKTSRWIQCKGCRTKGTVKCTHCSATGWLSCRQCNASGHEVAWLTYGQTTRWEVVNHPESPIVAAHPQLREHRFLAPRDLEAFGVVSMHEGVETGGGYRHLPVRAADPRLERISQQQTIKLSIVRRDAKFAMAGIGGTLVLSGRNLIGTRLDDSMRPIRRRNTFAAVGCSVLTMGSLIALGACTRSARYFVTANLAIGFLSMASLACGIVAVIALLRAWRPVGFGKLQSYEKLAVGLAVMLFGAMPILRAVTGPSLSDARSAIAAGDSARARLLVGALQESGPQDTEVQNMHDELVMIEAKSEPLAQRIALLDEVATHGTPTAPKAAAAAESTRIEYVQTMLASQGEDKALAAMDQWYPAGTATSPAVNEARASVFDAVRAKCTTPSCGFIASRRAVDAASTPARIAAAVSARDAFRAALVAPAPAAETPLNKVRRLRTVIDAGREAAAAKVPEPHLITLAKNASTQASLELARIPAVGGSMDVAEELLGGEFATVGAARLLTDGGLAIRLIADAQGRCVGLYAVGAAAGARSVKGTRWGADGLLSQAVGKASAIRSAPGSTGATKWTEGSLPVTARWDSNQLVELRVGIVTP